MIAMDAVVVKKLLRKFESSEPLAAAIDVFHEVLLEIKILSD